MTWRVEKLEAVADLCLGKMLDKNKNRGEFLPYLANINVRWGEFNFNDLREMRFEQREMERYGLKYGDIVMCEGGEPGRCAIWKEQCSGMMFQKALHRIRPYACLIPEFLYYVLLHKGRAGHFAALFTGSTIKHLPREKLALVEVPVPPIDIQKYIISILSTYDDLIETNRRRIQLLERAARLLYKEWFVHLRFPGHETTPITDGVPQGWEKAFLPEVIDINPKTKVEKGKEILYVPMSALSEAWMTVNQSEFERRTLHTNVKFKKNDVLLARITPCLENGKTGRAYFLHDDEVACGSTEFIIMRGRRVSPEFTYCLSRSDLFREKAIKSMIGSSGRQRVQVSCFDSYQILLPPERLLVIFDTAIKPAFEQIRVLAYQNDGLVKARDLLLPKLMSGEVQYEGMSDDKWR